MWLPYDASQGYSTGTAFTVTEIENFDSEGDATGTLPVERFELFQRPVSRVEHRIEDESEVNVTEIQSLASDEEMFHDAPEQAEL